MNYTSIEQSKKLLELGISPESADLSYSTVEDNGEYCESPNIWWNIEYSRKNRIPCWSVGALLELMPKAINIYDKKERCHKAYHLNLYRAYYHCCGYAFGPSLNQENHDMLCTFGDDSWIDVIFKTVVWLLENNYIK